MSKTATRKAKQAEFLGETLGRIAENTRQAKLQKYEPPAYKHGFIVKPTNPGWIAGLERKVRQYRDRLNRCKPDTNLMCGWELDGEYFDKEATKYKLRMIELILANGEVNIEEFWDANKGIMYYGVFTRTVVAVVNSYCRLGGRNIHSQGGFLPTDADYDDTI